jgi:hypothetical protein
MKKIKWIMMGMMVLLAYSCNSNIYSEQLKAERALIENYIARQGIIVVDTLPADDQWGEKVYYRVPDYDNFYFHMTILGDTLPSAKEAEIESGETVLLRFKRYTLEEYSDTIYNWTTMDSSDPIKFDYLVNSEKACTGWQVALKYMRYTDSQCKIICPSKMGFSNENSSVTSYGYDLKIKIKRY